MLKRRHPSRLVILRRERRWKNGTGLDVEEVGRLCDGRDERTIDGFHGEVSGVVVS